jgi:hypothetical protein
MPTDHNPQHGRRPHYNRGRRGPDRRGPDRRSSPQTQEPSARPQGGDHVDVEQIMRDIRARIAQRHGIELSTQQIQELAARRLEAILDPRTLNPSLMEQLRRNAGAAPGIAPAAPDTGFTFEDATLFETHRGFLRFMRRLLNPILKLFFNPTPLTDALKTQSRLNREWATREADRERRQTEWNALHYDILQRLVTEVSRVSIEMQSLALRVESLSTKVDFNDRRVRSLETSAPPARSHQQPRQEQPRAELPPAQAPVAVAGEAAVTEPVAAAEAPAPAAEGTRRKRRRRRGRRSGGGSMEGAPVAAGAAAGEAAAGDAADADLSDGDEGDDDEQADAPAAPPVVAGFVSPSVPVSEVREAPAPAPFAAPSDTVAAVQPEPALASPPTFAPPAPAPTASPEPEPVQPTPPRDEPSPAAPVDHQDPGPPDR